MYVMNLYVLYVLFKQHIHFIRITAVVNIYSPQSLVPTPINIVNMGLPANHIDLSVVLPFFPNIEEIHLIYQVGYVSRLSYLKKLWYLYLMVVQKKIAQLGFVKDFFE